MIKASILLVGFSLISCYLQAQHDQSELVADSIKNGSSVIKDDDLTQRYQPAIDSLNQIVRFLESIIAALEDGQADRKSQIEKTGRYLREGGKEMEESLARNFSILHQKNETMKADLTRRFHYLMHSLALYRSDLRSSDFRETEDSKKEYEYLRSGLPQLIERLKYMITYNRYTDWKEQKRIEELNGYLQDAFGQDTPIVFKIDGIYSETVKSISWQEVEDMTVHRNKGEVIITSSSGREIIFHFSEEQYMHIASMHVHFLAYFKEFRTP